ncbi:MAG: hypothetical protein C4533_06865 [Candidatus Omnitrophota bacterium]|jgi:hypothetical protein|nr:MAG: hypothetical protein C4533_06865 [Candidatus Omnitrophota bacterium]
MRVEKERRKVNIFCEDKILLRGFIHINPGERVIDFINDLKEDFIAVTVVQVYYPDTGLISKRGKSEEKGLIILNKAKINWIEEVTN